MASDIMRLDDDIKNWIKNDPLPKSCFPIEKLEKYLLYTMDDLDRGYHNILSIFITLYGDIGETISTPFPFHARLTFTGNYTYYHIPYNELMVIFKNNAREFPLAYRFNVSDNQQERELELWSKNETDLSLIVSLLVEEYGLVYG